MDAPRFIADQNVGGLARCLRMLGFDTLFTEFHLISFSNDFWLLDPNIDVLIMMFPDGFWFDVVAFITILTAVLAVIVGGVGFVLRNLKSTSQN